MRNFTFSIFILVLFLSARSKAFQEQVPASITYISLTNSDIEAAFEEFEEVNSDGEIIIQDNHHFDIDDTLREILILGGTANEELTSGPLTVGNIQISKVHGDFIYEGYLQQDEQDLYGTNITVGVGPYFQTITFYSPKRIFARSEKREVSAGSVITSTPDTANMNKILILLDFEAFGQQDTNLINYPPIKRQLVTEDDGS